MRVSVTAVGAFAENAYYLVEGNAAVLVDPGAEPERLAAEVDASGAALEAIWVTHGHLDHIGAIAALVRRYGVPVYLHPADLPLYRAGARQAAAYGIPFEQPPDPDRALAEPATMSLGSQRFAVWHLPGHSPGHVAFVGSGAVFAGDVLFAGSIGRTDLPLSDGSAMERSLARLAGLPPDTVVYPGHGPPTTIGDESRNNPFLSGVARPARHPG